MFDLKDIWDLLRARPDAERAKISAYVLAPGIILGWTILGSNGGLGLDVGKPAVISELRTETRGKGDLASRPGVVIIAEPMPSEYRIQLDKGTSMVWSSLDESQMLANSDHLISDSSGLKSRTPFVGVNGPVAVVVDGDLGSHIQIPGGTENVDDWRLSSRRSSSVASSILLACVFGFGLSLATGLPTPDGDKRITTEVSAEPHKD